MSYQDGIRQAQRERDHESLEVYINRKLRQDGILPGEYGAMGQVVAEIAPGWEFRDASVVGKLYARVVLTNYDPDAPL